MKIKKLALVAIILIACQLSASLHHAARQGETDKVQALVNAGDDVNARDCGKTALMYAAANGTLNIVLTLLNAGAEVDRQDFRGWTALMKAAFMDRTESVRALLNYGADVKLKNNDGGTALQIAVIKGHAEIVLLLKNYINLLKQLSEVTLETKKEMVREIITNDFSMLLKPFLTPEIVAAEELMALVSPDGFVARLLREYKERFIMLRAIFKFPEARQDQEAKTWDKLPVELINKLVLHQIE